MPFFVKRPVQIEARQHDGSAACGAGLVQWITESGHSAAYQNGRLTIETLEGAHLANPGDFVIQGVAGEFYPCKPEIFEATYDPA